jgi:phosphopantothenoylcysteine decarboxylase/phosphopantothenate--cysteine ligase
MNNNILLCVTGGIAAYKACDVARELMRAGCVVRVMMTRAAQDFVTPLTFEALTGKEVIADGVKIPGEGAMPHIESARQADLILVAPATANIIGKYANGIADDMVTTTLLAADTPVLMAPAMNHAMYEQPAVCANIATLAHRGVGFVGPDNGVLACGEEGVGKLAPVEQIVTAALERLQLLRDLAGVKILVTVGGTREPIDAVRFISNRSSGKMGFAIAAAAYRRGAQVTIIAGATEVAPPEGITLIRVERAEEMLSAVTDHFAGCDALFMTAAVGDYQVANRAGNKVKSKQSWDISLVANPDILATVTPIKGERIVVGFAAETDDAIDYGRKKLLNKNLDMIVINDVSRPDIGFATDDNEVTIITRSGEPLFVPKASKAKVAAAIINGFVALRSGRAILSKTASEGAV